MRIAFVAVLSLASGLTSVSCFAQEAGTAGHGPVTWTTQEDHADMMRQLGITALRPGPSGNEQDPNHANYDESLANPYPNLPELLTTDAGEPVTTPEQWWEVRRPEIVEIFEREVFGRVPQDVPAVSWTVAQTREVEYGGVPVTEKHLVGKVDNADCPSIEVNISMSVALPKDAQGSVPALMMFGWTPFDPVPDFFRRRSREQSQSGQSQQQRQGQQQAANPPPRRIDPRAEALIKAGWGVVVLNPSTIQPDNGAGLTRGVIGLANCGRPRTPEQWGALRAWAWGASRGLDHLETIEAVDADRVGIEGVSRYGKAALVTMAFDQRFAAALVGSSGEGGAKLHRRNFGEAVESLTGSGEYHWMAGNFLKYGAAESSFGSKNAGDIPVDAHQLIALCAPRPVFISYGIPEKGDAKWLDQQGSFMAAVAAQRAYRLLGAEGLGRSDDYMSEKMPPVNEGLLDGQLAWRQHDGGHTDAPNIEHFIAWAERQWTSSTRSSNE